MMIVDNNSPEDLYDISWLRANLIPDAAQSIQIERILASQEQRSIALRRELQERTAHLPSLQTEYDAVCLTMAVHRALLAPVRRLPPEVLMEVFESYVNADVNSSLALAMISPLILTHVCYTWRRVAQGSPRLWTNVVVGLQYPREDPVIPSSPRDNSELIGMWLQNSGCLPLNVSLHPEKGPKSKELSEIVLGEFNRLRKARIAGSEGSDSALGIISSLSKSLHWTHLEEMTVEECNPPGDGLGDFQWEFPRLHSLKLQGALHYLQVFRSSSLRRVLLKDRIVLGSDVWIDFFRSCPGLEELDMPLSCIEYEDEPGLDSSVVIELPCLRRLFLSMDPDRRTSFAVTFMNNLRAPRVQRLGFYCHFLEYVHNSSVSRALRNIITNCSSTLEDLSWTGDFTLESGRGWLRNATKLTTLSVPYASLDLLVPEPDTDPSSWICPNLTTIRVSDYRCEDKRLKDVVEKRTLPSHAPPGANIQYLTGIDISELTIRKQISGAWVELLELRDFSLSHREFSIYEDRHDRWHDRWQ